MQVDNSCNTLSSQIAALKFLITTKETEEAYYNWYRKLEYQDARALAYLYEKETDELILKLFRLSDEARCHMLIHMMIHDAPEIVKALLHDRYITILDLMKSLEKNPSSNVAMYGVGLFGFLSLHHQLLRAGD